VVYRFGVLCFMVLCVLGLGYSVSAQDGARLEIKIEAPSSGGDNVIYMEKAGTSSTEPIKGAFIKSDDGKTLIINADKSGSAKTEKQINKEEKKELKSEMRQINKDGSSQADAKNQEAKKMLENKQDQGKGQPGATTTPSASPPAPSPQPQGQPPAPNNDGINLYINAIAGKSLFMPLGFVKREQKASYVLTGVVSNAENISTSKAFIEQTGSPKSFYVSTGDMVGDAKVTEIGEWGAKLDRSGEQIALKLGEGTRSGGMEGSKGGGERQRGGGDQKSAGSDTKRDVQADSSGGSKGNFDASKLPPFVQQMLKERGISIEELQNNPELQQKLRQEMMQRFQGGEGGGRRSRN
jgi:hypothetical protein